MVRWRALVDSAKRQATERWAVLERLARAHVPVAEAAPATETEATTPVVS